MIVIFLLRVLDAEETVVHKADILPCLCQVHSLAGRTILNESAINYEHCNNSGDTGSYGSIYQDPTVFFKLLKPNP